MISLFYHLEENCNFEFDFISYFQKNCKNKTMKKLLSTLSLILILSITYAQSNLIIFSEDGEAFSLAVDGSPAINITDSKAVYDGIKGDFVQAKITFNNAELGVLKKGLMIEPNMEITAILKKNKKGAFVLRPLSSVAIENAPTRALPPPPVATEELIKEESINFSNNTSRTTTTTKETTSTNMNVGVNEPEKGINMTVNINLNDAGASISSKFSEITTISSTTTTSASPNLSEDTFEKTEEIEEIEIICAEMSSDDFVSAKKSISSKSFAEDKMTLAKQILKSNCVSTDQVIDMMGIFTFEENKLEFAKMAHSRTVDNQNYYKVNDAFTYSSSIDELNEFLEGK